MSLITRNADLARFEWRGIYADRHQPHRCGWHWDRDLKVWFTSDIYKARMLNSLGDAMPDTMTAQILARAATNEERSRATALTNSAWADQINGFGPEHLSLFDYQKAGVDYILRTRKCILGDDMGLGKTMQAIAAAAISKAEHIVITCPASVAKNWQNQIKVWTGDNAEIIYGRTPCTPVIQEQWTIMPYSIVGWRWEDVACDFLISDECHYLKEPDTLRTRSVVGGWDKAKRKAIPSLANGVRYFVGLTGTPVPNRPRELQPLLVGGCRKRWAYGRDFLDRFCGPQVVHRGNREITTWDGATNIPELSMRLREECMLRRTKKQVLHDLPSKIRDKVILDPEDYKGPELTKEQQQAIMDAVELGSLPEFEFISEVRREQGLAKVPLAVDFIIDTCIRNRDKIIPAVVFCHHHEVAKALQLAFDQECIKALCVTGATPSRLRPEIIESFEGVERPFLIGTTGAIGTGVDGLQHIASHAFFVELDWVPGNLDQAEDRLCRFGQEGLVNIYHMIVPGTIDSYMYQRVISKQKTISQILGD